jgi:hypothetical protein
MNVHSQAWLRTALQSHHSLSEAFLTQRWQKYPQREFKAVKSPIKASRKVFEKLLRKHPVIAFFAKASDRGKE